MSVRIVKFNCHGCHAPAYGCSFPGDNSGDYVLHADSAALLARVVRLEEALRELLDYTRACEGLLNASESGTCVKARRALEEK